MKTKSKKPAKSVAPKPQFCPLDEWHGLTFGFSDQRIADLLRVSRATARRWRIGQNRVPWMAGECLRMHKGAALPAVFRDFAGFQVLSDGPGGQQRIVPPGVHWRDGMTAHQLRHWQYYRDALTPRVAGMLQVQKTTG